MSLFVHRGAASPTVLQFVNSPTSTNDAKYREMRYQHSISCWSYRQCWSNWLNVEWRLHHQHYHGSQHQLVEKPSVENKILRFTCQIVDLLQIVPTDSGKMNSSKVGDFLAIPFTERSFYLSSGAADFPWELQLDSLRGGHFFPSVVVCITNGLLDLAGSHMFSGRLGAKEIISLQLCDLF
ncbi:uncharacterized protein LOC124648941 isoform X2 [Lolium rigidum]|uniref:uncharacterized protein LOC124648941 isoform X2 n=1 Tax=Lolium rigidum TaxID=89674 RepID=UPI001F5D18AC|nr:uncharacterized protein LOC124648941 isoform X2 [Lolium rigidum]